VVGIGNPMLYSNIYIQKLGLGHLELGTYCTRGDMGCIKNMWAEQYQAKKYHGKFGLPEGFALL